jgi:PleD family two-component response regulator
VARFGGEEFLLVLSNTDVEGALVVCDKLRHAIAGVRIPGMPGKASASFGIAAGPARDRPGRRAARHTRPRGQLARGVIARQPSPRARRPAYH